VIVSKTLNQLQAISELDSASLTYSLKYVTH